MAECFGSYHDRLVSMFESIGSLLITFDIYKESFPKNAYIANALSGVYYDILVFCTEVKNGFIGEKDKKSRSMLHDVFLRFLVDFLLFIPFIDQPDIFRI